MENKNIVRPKLQESFTKFERKCPWHTKSRCGRAFCSHTEANKKGRCSKYNCPFYREIERSMNKRRTKTEFTLTRRFRNVLK